MLPAQIQQFFLPPRGGAAPSELIYRPFVLGAADVAYANAKYNIQETRRVARLCPIGDGAVPVDWGQSSALAIGIGDLEKQPDPGIAFADCPAAASKPKNYDEWSKLLNRWLRSDQPITLFQSPSFKIASAAGESERDFRIRLQELARQRRDQQVDELRKRYAARVGALEDRLRRAEQQIAHEQQQSSAQTLNSVVAIGESLLGSFFGRKRNTITTAVRGFGRIQNESGDVNRAQENASSIRTQLNDMQSELQREIDGLSASFDAQTEPLETITIAPKTTDIAIHFVGIAWAPFKSGEPGQAAWI